MDNVDEFLADMKGLSPDILDYTDAFTFAMNSCKLRGEALLFGAVGSGVFFSGDSLERCRWFPDTKPGEAVGVLEAEFGEEVADAIRR